MATSDRGLGSENMSEKDKEKIHEAGGKASHGSRSGSSSKSSSSGSDVTTNRSGGGRLTPRDKSKGGRH